jgi:hypothetical protein
VTVTGLPEARQQLAGLCQAELRAIHALILGLNPHEEAEVVAPGDDGGALRSWVSVSAMEKDEMAGKSSAMSVEGAGTVIFDPRKELNEFTKPAARDNSWKPRLFISYSHTDDRHRKTLELHLKLLVTLGIVDSVWTDANIQPGDAWDETIKDALEEADVILLLVSASSLASGYIDQVELKRALERHEAGEAVATGVILEECGWKKTALAKWQVILPNRKPVLDNRPQRNGWNAVAEDLHKVFERLRSRGPRKI